MNETGQRAMLFGLLAGGLVLAVGVVWLRFAQAGVVRDLVTYGLAIVVAPVAAAVSTAGMRASSRRVLAIAGLASLLALATVLLLDYLLTFVLFAPGLVGPLRGKGEVSKEEVLRVADVWLLGRHVMACALGLFGGSILGVWRTRARTQ